MTVEQYNAFVGGLTAVGVVVGSIIAIVLILMIASKPKD